jgi:predicted amidohydrolase
MSVLAEARAIENQAFVLLANRCGEDSAGNVFCGHSGLFGPFGAIETAGEDERLLVAELPAELLEKSRRSIRVFDDRRKGIDFD